MSVDIEFARWLREGALYASADSGATALWGVLARSTEIQSPLALSAGATAEATRQIAFLGGPPIAVDVHLVDGLQSSLIGRTITITGDRLGYDAGALVFVIGVEEQTDVDQTKLTVLRKLA